MILSIHQPSFFPWLGLIDKIAKSDKFVILDDVQANKASYQFRNIFYCNGEAKFLSLPVDYSLGIKLCDLHFKNGNWADEHINKLSNYYMKAPFYKEVFPIVELFYLKNIHSEPIELIKNSMICIFELLNIKVEIINSSSLNCVEKKGSLVLEICKKLNCDTYLSGRGALNYMDSYIIKSFEEENINIIWHNFIHPIYNQGKNKNFVPGLSILDLLFFEGILKGQEIFWFNLKQNK